MNLTYPQNLWNLSTWKKPTIQYYITIIIVDNLESILEFQFSLPYHIIILQLIYHI